MMFLKIKLLIFIFVIQSKISTSNGELYCKHDDMYCCLDEFLAIVTPIGINLSEKSISSICHSKDEIFACLLDFVEQCLSSQDEPILLAVNKTKQNIEEICQPESYIKKSAENYGHCYENSNEKFVTCYQNRILQPIPLISTSKLKWKAACCDYMELHKCANFINCKMIAKEILKFGIQQLYGIDFELACEDFLETCNIVDQLEYTTSNQECFASSSIAGTVDPTLMDCGPDTIKYCLLKFLPLISPTGIHLTEEKLSLLCSIEKSTRKCLEMFNYHCSLDSFKEMESDVNNTILFVSKMCQPGSKFRETVMLEEECFIKVSNDVQLCYNQELQPESLDSDVDSKWKIECCNHKRLKRCAMENVQNVCSQTAADLIQEYIEEINGAAIELICKDVCDSAFTVNTSYILLLITLSIKTYIYGIIVFY